MLDVFSRDINYLRVSLTDKCDLRCRYCVPEKCGYLSDSRQLLTTDEIYRIIKLFSESGITKVRFTGGEPFLRKGAFELFRRVRALEGIKTMAVTTNGTQIMRYLPEITSCGLDSINISLDTLRSDEFEYITRCSGRTLEDIISGYKALLGAGLRIRINCVPVRGMNEGSVVCIAGLARSAPVDVRFIELMPIGCAKGLSGVDSADVLSMLENEYGKAAKEDDGQSSTAEYYGFSGFKGRIGLISPMTHKFCKNCSRIRITADGILKTCLCYEGGADLRALIRSGADDSDIVHVLGKALASKPYEHGFGSIASDMEKNNMNTIGG